MTGKDFWVKNYQTKMIECFINICGIENDAKSLCLPLLQNATLPKSVMNNEQKIHPGLQTRRFGTYSAIISLITDSTSSAFGLQK